MKIILASHNEGKIREFKESIKNISIDLIPQSDFHIQDIEETGLTFVENAIQKARHAANVTGLPAIADDSGLSVPALFFQPGIHSARYAGPNATSQDNIKKLLTALKNTPDEDRQAHFHCVIVYLNHANDPMPLICEGHWAGMIAVNEQGYDGFGYDPIFYIPSENKTAAELSLARKNQISHRAIALHSLIQQLPEKLMR
jgi:XTP/dITP diphosphohydrolase